MKLAVVTVRDRALEAFGRPIFTPAVGVGVRSFGDEVNNPQGEMHKHPEDYDLYHLGFWHDDTGVFELYEKPVLVGRGVDYKSSGGR